MSVNVRKYVWKRSGKDMLLARLVHAFQLNAGQLPGPTGPSRTSCAQEGYCFRCTMFYPAQSAISEFAFPITGERGWGHAAYPDGFGNWHLTCPPLGEVVKSLQEASDSYWLVNVTTARNTLNCGHDADGERAFLVRTPPHYDENLYVCEACFTDSRQAAK